MRYSPPVLELATKLEAIVQSCTKGNLCSDGGHTSFSSTGAYEFDE